MFFMSLEYCLFCDTVGLTAERAAGEQTLTRVRRNTNSLSSHLHILRWAPYHNPERPSAGVSEKHRDRHALQTQHTHTLTRKQTIQALLTSARPGVQSCEAQFVVTLWLFQPESLKRKRGDIMLWKSISMQQKKVNIYQVRRTQTWSCMQDLK